MDWGFNLCIYDSTKYDITVASIDSYWYSISCLMLSEKSPISIRYNHQKQVSECSYHIGVGFPYLHGYRCLAIPSDKQLRLGSHLLFVVWLQKEIS